VKTLLILLALGCLIWQLGALLPATSANATGQAARVTDVPYSTPTPGGPTETPPPTATPAAYPAPPPIETPIGEPYPAPPRAEQPAKGRSPWRQGAQEPAQRPWRDRLIDAINAIVRAAR